MAGETLVQIIPGVLIGVYSAQKISIFLENVMSENFTKLVESFYGSTVGNIQSPVWLCGLEWGGGYDPETPILESELEPYGMEDLQATSLQDFIDSFWAAKSPFCRNTMKLLCELYNCTDPKEKASYGQNWETWEKLGIVGSNGLALILNAYPISFENRSVAGKSWDKYKIRTAGDELNPISLSEWTGIENFEKYLGVVVERRSKIYANERKSRSPKLIICFGIQHQEAFFKLWGVEGEYAELEFNFDKPFDPTLQSAQLPTPNCFATWADDTLVAVVPFPSGSNGLNSDDRIKNVSAWLYHAVSEKYGSDWLKILHGEIPDETDDGVSEILSEIWNFKNLVNQQLACLERLEESIARFPSSRYSTVGGKKKLESLKEILVRDCLHEFDALRKELKDQQDQKIKEILEQLR